MTTIAKRRHLRTAFLLSLLLMLGLGLLPKTALANENECLYTSKEEVMAYTSSLLETVSESEDYPNTFMIPEFSVDGIMVGDPVKCYDIIDGQVVYSNADYWPILFNSEIICSVTSIDNGDGSVSFILSSGVASELNAAYYANEPCAVILSGETFEDEVVTPSDAQMTLAAYSTEDNATTTANMIEYFQQDDFTILDANATEVAYTAVDESENTATFALPRPGGASLTVPLKQQIGGTCWAYSVSSIGEYKTGKSINGTTICQKIKGVADAGGTDSEAARGLALFTYPGTSTPVNGEVVTGPLSNQYIYNWLSSCMPIYAHLAPTDGTSHHAVVVCECQNTSNGVFTVTVMNPGHGDYETMAKNSNDILALYYNNKYFNWSYSSVLLKGWQKPYNSTKWTYMPSNDGLPATGWLNLNSTYYFFDEIGLMYESQWHNEGSNWYYLKANGAMAKSEWELIGNYYYAFDASGAMRRGWYKEGTNWYYLRTAANTPGSGPDGSMLANGTWTINGKSYKFDSNGVCLNP